MSTVDPERGMNRYSGTDDSSVNPTPIQPSDADADT